jgi:hypothetical protein
MAGQTKHQKKKWQDLVHVERRYRRSIHLERDFTTPDSLTGYVVTPLVAGTLARVGDGLLTGGGRAWSFTGPYGSGKSAFAVYLANLLHFSDVHGGPARRMFEIAVPDLHRRIFSGKAAPRLVPVLATGERASLETIVLRALARAGLEFWKSGPRPKLLKQIDRALAGVEEGSRIGSREVVSFVEEFADKVAASKRNANGIILLIDEAGKALEFAAHHPDRADVQLLQELAEAANRSGDRPIVVGVLLHQAFDQYATRLGSSQRNEWAKVQGRFEDVAFQEPADQLLQLIAKAIGLKSLPFDVKQRAQAVVDDLVGAVNPPGMPDKEKLADRLSRTLPLHPVTALLLGPLFRSQISQNERSLFAFLSSAEPGAFQDFLGQQVEESGSVQTYRPDRLFNYLSSALGERLYRFGGRQWAQIDAALPRLPKDAGELDARVLKTVGLIGLLGEGAGVPASERVIQLALTDGSSTERSQVSESLERLRAASVLVFRRFKNSYQLWDGSDLDLDQRVRTAVGQLDPRAQLVRLLERAVPPRPMLARRHLFETGTLRYFEVRYGDETILDGEWAAQDTAADGVVWILVPTSDSAAHDVKSMLNRESTWLGHGGTSKPVVIGVMDEVGRLRESAIELAALEWVKSHTPELESDPVARKELAGRILEAETTLRQELSGLVTGERSAAWYFRGKAIPSLNGRQLSGQLSTICDEVYDKAPRILNEMLNRSQLSSAAAGARRELLVAMVEHRGEAKFGIDGFPPELSMYRSVFEEHGLHREVDGEWRLAPPKARTEGSLALVVKKIEKSLGHDGARLRLSSIYAELQRPPFGMKEGPIPVLILWVLLKEEAEIALYEEGAFVPALNGPVIERLLRSPDKFEVQRFQVAGAREEFADQLTGRDDAADSGPLPLVRQFVRAVQDLPPYSKVTRELSPSAIAVRDTILKSKEPGTLVFHDLPKACGYEPLAAGKRSALPENLIKDLQAALKELRSAFPQLLRRIREQVLRAFEIPGATEAARGELAARCKRLIPLASDLDLKTFVVRAGGDYKDLDAWTTSVGTLLAGRPPEAWSDLDLQRMSVSLAMVSRKFGALEAAFVEHQGAGMPEGSVAVRVSVTEAGQQEAERVVIIRKDDRRIVDAVAERLRAAVQAERGDATRESLVASLAKVIRELVSEVDADSTVGEGAEQ